MIETELNKITEYSLSMLEDDYTELWVITEKIYEIQSNISIKELIDILNLAIKRINRIKKVKIVDLNTETEILLDEDELLQKVRNHILLINKRPNIGDGLWLTV